MPQLWLSKIGVFALGFRDSLAQARGPLADYFYGQSHLHSCSYGLKNINYISIETDFY